MEAVQAFERLLTGEEWAQLAELDSPLGIQAFLDRVPYSTEAVYRSPLSVLRDHKAHCFDGALFAAAALRRIGYPPLILQMLPNGRDDDHILALYKQDRHWGAVAKSNFVGLRFREAIYRTLRELVLSYFESYYNIEREKTLRGYTAPLNLEVFDDLHWMDNDEHLEAIALRLDEIRRFFLLTPQMAARLSPVDERTYRAGLLGAEEAGLYKPCGVTATTP